MASRAAPFRRVKISRRRKPSRGFTDSIQAGIVEELVVLAFVVVTLRQAGRAADREDGAAQIDGDQQAVRDVNADLEADPE